MHAELAPALGRFVDCSIARMEDGIFCTALPYVFRVHSTSGAVEWRLVDMSTCLCSCPNDGPICSHR